MTYSKMKVEFMWGALSTCHFPIVTLDQVAQASNHLDPSIQTMPNSSGHGYKKVISLQG